MLVRSVVKWGKPIVDGLIANGIPVQWPILNKGGPFINEFLLPVFSWLHNEHPQPKSKAEEARAQQQATRLWETVRRWIPADRDETIFWQAINVWLDAIEEQRNAAYNVGIG